MAKLAQVSGVFFFSRSFGNSNCRMVNWDDSNRKEERRYITSSHTETFGAVLWPARVFPCPSSPGDTPYRGGSARKGYLFQASGI